MKKQVKKSKKITKGMPSAVLLSIAIHAALFFLAGMLVVFTVVKKKEIEFEPPKAVERPKMKLKKPKPKIKKSSRPKQAKHILAKVNPVNMPEIQLPELSGGGLGDGLGDGFGGGFNTMPDLGDVSVFGETMSIGNDFVGTYYDFNRDRRGRNIAMEANVFRQKIRNFVLSGWKPSKLAQYYRSPKELYTTHFMMPLLPSPMAPDAFGVPEAKSSYFMVHYKGKLFCPTSYPDGITIRFHGSGDSFMAVRVDGKEVLIASWRFNLREYFTWWNNTDADHRKYYLGIQRAAVGDWITLEPGKPLEMEVLFGEVWGGDICFLLTVEVKGEEYNERGWQGNPIFPAFKTQEFSRDMLDHVYDSLAEGEASLTNGPVFCDFGSAGGGKAAVSGVADAPSPEESPEAVEPSPGEDGMRTWTLVDGRTFEAEYVTTIGRKSVFKSKRGKTLKMLKGQICEEDREFIELESPPVLDISFSKQSRQRDFTDPVPDAQWQILPVSHYYTFSANIKQTSPGDYNHELRAEIFAVGAERGNGDRYILLDHQEDNFMLTEENQRQYRFSGKTVELLKKDIQGYSVSGPQVRGREYAGYLVVVTDERGKIIAHGTSKKWLFENLEDLRKLSPGNFFDKTCTRTFPTRPEPYGFETANH
ncbi:MAG: hypothetical protein ABFR33_07865 [Verrucomicrobiota bacterium]